MLGKVLSFVAVLIILVGGGIFYARHTSQGQNMCMSSCMQVDGCSADVFKPGTHQLDVSCLAHQTQCRSYCGVDNTVAANANHMMTANLQHPATGPQPTRILPKLTAPHASFGAIAYDSGSGAWGLGEPQKDIDAAKSSAIKICLRYGTGCKVVDTFYNTCVAVATGKNSTIAWSRNTNLQHAKDEATVNCFKSAKSMCEIKLTNCYTQ